MRNKKLVAYTLGEKITQLRKNMNLTQQEVANRLHLERSTYAHYEIEKTTPSAINLLSIARLFNVTEELLIDDKLRSQCCIHQAVCFVVEYKISKNSEKGSYACPARTKLKIVLSK